MSCGIEIEMFIQLSTHPLRHASTLSRPPRASWCDAADCSEKYKKNQHSQGARKEHIETMVRRAMSHGALQTPGAVRRANGSARAIKYYNATETPV